MTSSADVKQQVRQALGPATDALPPHNIEAEEAVLNALLMLPSFLDEVAPILEPGDFWLQRHEWLYEALLTIWRRDEEVDSITLAEELRQKGRLEEIGGAAFLTRVSIGAPDPFFVLNYAHLVQRLADRRKLIEYHRARLEAAWNEETPITTLYADDMQGMIDLKPRALDRALTTGESVSKRFMELQARGEGSTKVFTLPFGGETGLPFLTGGKLFGIGGDEKTGKSALAETLSEHWAQLGHKGFYIHTEEKADAKIYRRFSRWSGIPFLKLEAGQLSASDLDYRAHALEVVKPWEKRLDLWYESLPSPERIISLIRRAIQVFHVDFIVLDNFTDVDFSNRNRTTSQAQEAMKLLQQVDDLAARYGVLIVLVTQMTTQLDGKRIAYGTSGFNKKMTWFWDINRKQLKEPFEYEADGEKHRLEPGAFDPRVDIFVPASRYGSGAKIEAFADLRRFYWRDRCEARISPAPGPVINHPVHWNDQEPESPAPLDLG